MLADGETIFLGPLDQVPQAEDPRVRQFFDREPDPNPVA